MTDEGITLEYEASLCGKGAKKNICPKCKTETYRKFCPVCPVKEDAVELTGDQLADQIFADMAEGKDFDLERLRGGRKEPVKDEFAVLIPGSEL